MYNGSLDALKKLLSDAQNKQYNDVATEILANIEKYKWEDVETSWQYDNETDKMSELIDEFTEKIKKLDYAATGNVFTGVITGAKNFGAEYVDVKKHEVQPTQDEIIKRVGGGDMTAGSCSSLAFAFAGNMCGYDVLDFRGGKSLDFSQVH